jgi:hypothetical protein
VRRGKPTLLRRIMNEKAIESREKVGQAKLRDVCAVEVVEGFRLRSRRLEWIILDICGGSRTFCNLWHGDRIGGIDRGGLVWMWMWVERGFGVVEDGCD